MITLLWDLDGTLIDSLPAISQSLNKTVVHYGKPEWAEHRLRAMIGPELGEILAHMLELTDEHDILAAKDVYRSYYTQEMLKSPLFDGILEALTHFRDMGVAQFVATAKYQQYAADIIEALSLSSFFTGVYGSTIDGLYGDKKELLAHIVDEEGIRPSQTIMIGDTRFDIEAGRFHKMTTIAVGWGYGDEESLSIAGPHFVAPSPDLLADVVKKATECGC